jgi:hypothetical protein
MNDKHKTENRSTVKEKPNNFEKKTPHKVCETSVMAGQLPSSKTPFSRNVFTEAA